MPQPQPSTGLSIPDFIRQEAIKVGIPPEFALAVAEQESEFNPDARNPESGAIGLFQFLPETARTRGVNAEDPVQNVQGGVRYLRELLDQHKGDVEQVLRAYGGVKTNTTYVPSVLGRMQRFGQPQAPTQVPGGPPPPLAVSHARPITAPEGGPPAPQSMMASLVAGFDPRTRTGRRNLAATAGGIATGALTGAPAGMPGAIVGGVRGGLMRGAMIAAGAGASGALAETAEQVVGREPIRPGQIAIAGAEQAGLEAAGGVVSWPLKAIGRHMLARVMGPQVRKTLGGLRAGVETQLERQRTTAEAARTTAEAAQRVIERQLQTTVETAHAGVQAARSRIAGLQPAVTPTRAGRMVEAAVQGPSRSVLDEMGQAVEAAARTGPRIPTQPLRDRLNELATQITPLAGQPTKPPLSMRGTPITPPPGFFEAHPELMLPAEHPLPGTLARIREELADVSEISFADAHKYKRMLDEAVNWGSPAKRQAQQVTKAARTTLRELMSGHPPYEQATAAYRATRPLFEKGTAAALHKQALENPEALIKLVKADEPTKLKMLFDALQLGQKADPAAGEAARDALRASWTYERVIRGAPEELLGRIDKMSPDFADVMYGDTAGKTVLLNLRQIGSALEQAGVRADAAEATLKAAEVAGKAELGPQGPIRQTITQLKQLARQTKKRTPVEQAFRASVLARPPTLTSALSDLAYLATSPRSPWGYRAAIRQLVGADGQDLIQWASYSPQSTQLFVEALTGPAPGLAITNLMVRMHGALNLPIRGEPAEGEMVPSHAPAGPPPRPAATPAP